MATIDPETLQNTDKKASQPGSIQYARLAHTKHPQYLEKFWKRARAFYCGGVRLLENPSVMAQVFPQHINEEPAVYEMRQKLAHYTNHSGAIVNHLLGKLTADPVKVVTDDAEDFYAEFLADTSPPAGPEVPLEELLSRTILEAAQTKCAYALVEMPNNLDTEYRTLAEQEGAGALHAWATPVKAESVVDWECDKSGEYKWALLCFESKVRPTVFEARNTITQEYWLYTANEWIRWDVTRRDDEEISPETWISPSASGPHSFGKVPLVKLELPDGLWIMSKLESLAREYFNKRNALSWAEFKALLPMLYEFLDPGEVAGLVGGATTDQDRAINQQRSPAHVQQRQAAPGGGDRVEWVAPPDAPFAHALSSCTDIRDEMHRVVHQMALAADTKGAMLRRSEGSKRQDTIALDIVLSAYGKILRKFTRDLLTMVQLGRGEEPSAWTVTGGKKFDMVTADAIIEEESILDTVEMPSPTARAERKKQLVRVLFGDTLTEEQYEEIDEEIDSYYSAEGELAQAEDYKLTEDVEAEQEPDGDDELERALRQGKGSIIATGRPGRR